MDLRVSRCFYRNQEIHKQKGFALLVEFLEDLTHIKAAEQKELSELSLEDGSLLKIGWGTSVGWRQWGGRCAWML